MSNPKIDEVGNQFWYDASNSVHREDGPAVIYTDGAQYWYLNGRLHRTDGPAIMESDNHRAWYLNGFKYHTNIEYQKAAKLTDEGMTLLILKYGNVGNPEQS